jgi:hypothetical protein
MPLWAALDEAANLGLVSGLLHPIQIDRVPGVTKGNVFGKRAIGRVTSL